MNQYSDVVYVTPEGLQQLEEELTYLQTEKREELSRKLEAAIAQGDLKENADYHDAKDEQGFVEARIRDIEDSLRRAQIIDENGPSDVVRVGSTVTVSEEGFDEEETYVIVGAAEADPAEGRISNESPIGQALLGSRVGDVTMAETPDGALKFAIISIS
jgi:transcription elongation factor GreA